MLFVGAMVWVFQRSSARIGCPTGGNPGEEGYLSFESFPHTLVKTYNVAAQTPDSAGTMTAMMSGLKTDVGVIGVDEDIERGDCPTVAGKSYYRAGAAEVKGLSTGIISTAITYATPAATYAAADRNWEDIDMPEPF